MPITELTQQRVISPDTPLLAELVWPELETGFFVRQGEAGVYFAGTHGKFTYAFPVMADGLIACNSACHEPGPGDRIFVVHPNDLGINKVEWAPQDEKIRDSRIPLKRGSWEAKEVSERAKIRGPYRLFSLFLSNHSS